jgi:hypothetical protein
VAKIVLFLGPCEHDVGEIRAYLLARLLGFEAVFEGCNNPLLLDTVAEDVAVLLLEPMLLRWPPSWIARCLLAYPFYRKSCFAKGVRKIGKLVKHNALLQIWSRDDSDFWHKFDAYPEVLSICKLGLELATADSHCQLQKQIHRRILR